MRRGMAIPLVLSFLIAMLTFGGFLFQMARQQNRQNITSFYQTQAHFLARAGMEHALLKVKYLQRELFDSACLAQGRNPLFDFSRKMDPNSNPGPMFLYHRGEAVPASDGFLTPNFESLFSGRFNPPKTWLNAFMADLSPGAELTLGIGKPLKVNGVLRLFPVPEEMRALVSGPFKKSSYEIVGLDVAAQDISTGKDDGKSMVKNQMVIEITVRAELLNNFNDEWKQVLKRTVRVSRDSR